MPIVSISAALELALRHHEAGRLTEAEVIYRQILDAQPHHAEAHHLLGVIAHQVGRHAAAAELIGRAIQLGLNAASAHSNLGEAYRKLGRLDDAIAEHRRATEINGRIPEFHCNLGSALMEKGQIEAAVAALNRALALRPDYAEAHGNLGASLAELGRFDEAVHEYRRAVDLNPDLLEPQFNLGVALTRLGKTKEAVAAFRRTTELRPGYAEAHHNLGSALLDLGELEAAIAAFCRALEIKPDYAEVHYNLGNALREQGHPDEAVVAYRRAIELQTDYRDPQESIAETHRAQGRLDEAVAALRGAAESVSADAALQSNLILTLHYVPELDERVIREEQARWNRRFGDPVRPLIASHVNVHDPDRRLRIGYVSADFRDHTLGRNLLPLFRRHDRADFEIICYSGVAHPDAVTEEFHRHADRWQSTVRMGDAVMADMIRSDGIDILVDLGLHTARNRLPVFARKPAPVQVSFAGYPGRTGLEAIPNRLSDRWLEGVDNDEWRMPKDERCPSERVYLLDSFWCYDPCGLDVPVNGLPAIETGRITFGSLNNFAKINESVLRLWSRVLQAVGGARLLLLCPAGAHRAATMRVLHGEGVAEHRVEFVAPQPRRHYLELFHQVDVMLDPFPYGGHTTSLDALWMGVPVVSLAGLQIVSRAGLSQLSNLGLPELVAFSEEDYVRTAAGLAADLPRLVELRGTLRLRMKRSVLMDGERLARGIETAYRRMWRQWCECEVQR
jgi:predicted O-linked N-acetylglucosamine transferase (SPINDLY family)